MAAEPTGVHLALMWLLNPACEVQSATHGMGRARTIAETVLAGCLWDSLKFNPKFGATQDAFDAMQRLIDRTDPSYRT